MAARKRWITEGQKIVQTYILVHREEYGTEDPFTALIDILANLRHYATSKGIDFDSADRMAAVHFRSETS